MSMLIRIPSASWANKGFPNVEPFLATGLVYGFDFRQRASWLTDVTGAYTITPKRNDPSLSVFNVTDPTILVPVDGGLGVRVELGYLQSSEPIQSPFPWGSAPFTIMVVGRGGEVTLPAGKVVGSAPNASTFYDHGSNVGGAGFALTERLSTGKVGARIEDASSNLDPDPVGRAVTVPHVLFLTYSGTNWTLTDKTLGLSATGSNASLAVTNPMALDGSAMQGFVNLGGNAHQSSTLHGHYPVIYQSAKWSRVLTGAEIDEQYARTKGGRSTLAL